MEHRHLGRSGLKVSEIAYGNWITHGSQVEEDAAVACVNAALDVGITTFDTADVYAGTRAEEVLGRALHGPAARGPRDLHQGLLADRSRRRTTAACRASTSCECMQRLAAPAADRLRRPLPGAPLRPRDAARGDAARLRRPRPPGQGALRRRLGVARRRRSARAVEHRRRRWASTGSCPTSRSTRCSGGSSRPRSCRPARARHRADRLVPDRAGRAHRQVPARAARRPRARAPPTRPAATSSERPARPSRSSPRVPAAHAARRARPG